MHETNNKFNALAFSDSDDEANPIKTQREARKRAAKLTAAKSIKSAAVNVSKPGLKKAPVAAVDITNVPYYAANEKKPKKTTVSKKLKVKNENSSPANDLDNPSTEEELLKQALEESRQVFERDEHQKHLDDQEFKKAVEISAARIVLLKYENSPGSSNVNADDVTSEYVVDTMTDADKIRFESIIESKDCEIDEMKEKLAKAKARTRLCLTLLNDSEYKEKAEILIENHRLKNVNDELSNEFNAANIELQQLRSKVHEMDKELKKHIAPPTK